MNQQSHATTTRQPSSLLVARILSMILENGAAMSARQPRRHSVLALNVLRAQLLDDEFFDELHRPEELRGRLRSRSILYMDVVVLLARLLRVTIRRSPLTDEEQNERVEVRNECLDQPFFNRALVNSNRPFVDEDFGKDEACLVD